MAGMTRKGIADKIDRVDDQIDDLQKDKRQIFAAYREHLDNDGLGKNAIKLELAAIKAAIRQRRALAVDATEVIERDSLIEQILEEIQKTASVGTNHATRARAPAPRASDPDPLDIPTYLART